MLIFRRQSHDDPNEIIVRLRLLPTLKKSHFSWKLQKQLHLYFVFFYFFSFYGFNEKYNFLPLGHPSVALKLRQSQITLLSKFCLISFYLILYHWVGIKWNNLEFKLSQSWLCSASHLANILKNFTLKKKSWTLLYKNCWFYLRMSFR